MRADRLLHIMILLQNQGKMTTRQLAEVLEVSERTILRDMDALSAAGIPVTSERGQTGGWKLIDRFRSSISGLKLDDLKSLFILPSDKLLEELGISAGGTDLRRKLIASMPHAVKTSAQQYMEKIYIDSGTWKPADKDDREAFREVQSALWEDRKLHIAYEKADGELTERQVLPLGLVAKGNAWYLVALNEGGEYRNYWVSRIRRAVMLPDTFTRPDSFDLIACWKRSKQQFAASLPRFEVRVAADRSIVGRLMFTDRFVQRVERESGEDEQTVLLRISFDTEQEAVEYVLGFGGKMEIVEPGHLIPLIVEQARQVLRKYGE